MSWHREGLGDRCWPARMGGWASQFFHPCHGQGCAHCQGRSCPWHEVHLRGHKVHLWGCRLLCVLDTGLVPCRPAFSPEGVSPSSLVRERWREPRGPGFSVPCGERLFCAGQVTHLPRGSPFPVYQAG